MRPRLESGGFRCARCPELSTSEVRVIAVVIAVGRPAAMSLTQLLDVHAFDGLLSKSEISVQISRLRCSVKRGEVILMKIFFGTKCS